MINQKDGMVSFYDNPEKYNNPAMLEAINKDVCELSFELGVIYGRAVDSSRLNYTHVDPRI